jgi:hypothetical protein
MDISGLEDEGTFDNPLEGLLHLWADSLLTEQNNLSLLLAVNQDPVQRMWFNLASTTITGRQYLNLALQDLKAGCGGYFSSNNAANGSNLLTELGSLSQTITVVNPYGPEGDLTMNDIYHSQLTGGNVTAAQFANTFATSESAYVLPTYYATSQSILPVVFLGPQFYTNQQTMYLTPTTVQGREMTLLHEALHIALQADDITMARNLGLGDFADRQSASVAIGKFLSNDCKK